MIQLDQGGRARASMIRLPMDGPAGDLAEELAILPEIRDPAPAGGGWRVIPDAHPHVIVVRYPDGRTRASLVGARSTWIDVDQTARSWTVGARLRPGAVPILARLPAHELLDRGLAVADLPGLAGRRLMDDLSASPGPSEAAAALRAYLARAATAGTAPDWKIRGLMGALAAAPRKRMVDLADDLGVATRTLRDAAREGVGLSPKRIQRVVRLQRALLLASAPGRRSGSQVALRAGYADQSHWTNECSDLLGESPGTFLDRGAR